jgi:hypothetical protein
MRGSSSSIAFRTDSHQPRAVSQLQGWEDSPIIDHTFGWQRGTRQGVSVRILLGVAVIAVGIANLCFAHHWHRVLGVVAIATGLILCALVWFR